MGRGEVVGPNMELTARALISVIAIGLALGGCDRDAVLSSERRLVIADEMEEVLLDELQTWYPLVVDTLYGGFLSRFTYDWKPEEPQDKMIVTQARHVWTSSRAALRYPDDPRYAVAAEHGYRFLRDVMWDSLHGGFYNLVQRDGTPVAESDGHLVKQAYGNAFGIYALAAYYDATHDQDALELARNAFAWLEAHSHDPAFGGYYQFMTRDGTAYSGPYENVPPKDQNSSIHLLEAFTELYRVWPDPLLEERLREMLLLVSDTMTSDRGYLRLFFDKHWTPVSYRDSSSAVREAHYHLDHVSFGHDVETAYLMLEAEEALAGETSAETETIARTMVDHALAHGWDRKFGGFYDRGYYLDDERPAIILGTKNWWAQAEALNTLSLMSDRFPEAGYLRRFVHEWMYVQENLIDHERGGWYESGLREDPDAERGLKAHIWKGNYHTARSLMNCIDRLRAVPVATNHLAHFRHPPP